MSELAYNYDSLATDDDGSCIIQGCTDSTAYNYNETANTDDSSCIIQGCIDSTASNYNETANTDDGSCVSWEELAIELQAELDNITPEDGIGQSDVDSAYVKCSCFSNT